MLEKNAVFLSFNKTNQCGLGVVCRNSKREEPEIILFMIMKNAVGLFQVKQMKASDAWLKLGEAKSDALQLNWLDWDGIDPIKLTWGMLN